MKKQLLLLVMMLIPMLASAYDAQIDGIYYNLDPKAKTAGVTYLLYKDYANGGAYSGDVTIPSEINYNNVTYKVTYIGDYSFFHCTHVTSVTLPNSVTDIGMGAFMDCSLLTTVIIGNSVKSIRDFAFQYCNNLNSITCIAESVPRTQSTAFKNAAIENATLYVPVSSVDIYKTSDPWCNFKTIIGIDNTGVKENSTKNLKIWAQAGILIISGICDETIISVYDIHGRFIGSAVSANGQAVIKPHLQKGNIAVVMIADTIIKLLVK